MFCSGVANHLAPYINDLLRPSIHLNAFDICPSGLNPVGGFFCSEKSNETIKWRPSTLA